MSSLGNDLALIREQQSMSIDDVQKITKIPPPILQSIEDDSIFTQLDENITYIRSYVRSYAKAIHIDEPDIARALNEVEAGTYEGSLFENTDIEDPDQDNSNASSDKKEFNDDKQKEDTDQDTTPPKNDKKRFYRPSQKPEGSKYMLSSTDKLSSVDWADIGHKAYTPDKKGPSWTLIWSIVIGIVILLAIYLLYNYFNDNGDTTSTPQDPITTTMQPVTPSDSLKQSLISSDQPLNRADSNAYTPEGTLSDTLMLAVHAAGGKLEPIRIYTDIMGVQNPYWIAQGDTMHFEFVNTIRIKANDQYQQVELIFNGHSIDGFYQQFYNQQAGAVELNRSIFEDHSKWRKLANSAQH